MKSTLLALLGIALIAAQAVATEFHVAIDGNDTQRGTKNTPLRTIQRAAELAQPGDTITVHAGVYRERVNPPRGGISNRKRIIYQAAKGEQVTITGSEVIKNWVKVAPEVWKVNLPNSFFGGFNPYADLIRGDWFDRRGRDHHTGAIYLNGDWLTEAASLDEVLMPDSPAWLSKASSGVLLNVAWLQPGGSSETNARIPATRMAARNGTTNAPCSEGGECIGWIMHGDWVRYDGADFKAGTDQVEIRAASASEGGIIELRLDGPDGELLSRVPVANTGGWQDWVSHKAKIRPLSGVKSCASPSKVISAQRSTLSCGLLKSTRLTPPSGLSSRASIPIKTWSKSTPVKPSSIPPSPGETTSLSAASPCSTPPPPGPLPPRSRSV